MVFLFLRIPRDRELVVVVFAGLATIVTWLMLELMYWLRW